MKDEAECYRLLLENRRARRPLRLDEPSLHTQRRRQRSGGVVQTPLGAVIGRAARLLAERTRAEAAWRRLADPSWIGRVRVEGIVGEFRDTLSLSVASSTVLYELRRRQAALERQLARLAPGIRRIKLTLGAGESGADA